MRLDLMIVATALATLFLVSGCGSTVQPRVDSGEVSDETLSKNTVGVGLVTFQEVQNFYGTTPIADYRAKDNK